MSPKKPTLEQDRAAYLDLEQKRLEIVAAQDAIKARIRAAYSPGTNVPFAGGGKVALTANRRFDPMTAGKVLEQLLATGQVTQEDLAEMTEQTLVSSKVKRKLTPEQYEACMKESGDPRVTIA